MLLPSQSCKLPILHIGDPVSRSADHLTIGDKVKDVRAPAKTEVVVWYSTSPSCHVNTTVSTNIVQMGAD